MSESEQLPSHVAAPSINVCTRHFFQRVKSRVRLRSGVGLGLGLAHLARVHVHDNLVYAIAAGVKVLEPRAHDRQGRNSRLLVHKLCPVHLRAKYCRSESAKGGSKKVNRRKRWVNVSAKRAERAGGQLATYKRKQLGF